MKSQLFCAIALLATAAVSGGEFPSVGEIKVANKLNVRAAPAADAALLGQLPAGTKVVVLEKKGEFYKLQYPRQLEAWIAAWMLLDNGKNPSDVVARDKVNVRGGPGTEYPQVCTLDKGEKVEILKLNRRNWASISPPLKAEAWVATQFVVVGETLAKFEAKRRQQEEAHKMLDTAIAGLKEHMDKKQISDEEYAGLRASFEKVGQLAPNSDEERRALEQKALLEQFWGVMQLEQQRTLAKEKIEEEKRKIDEKYQEDIKKIVAPIEQQKKFQFIGWVESVGGLLYRPATHRLKEGGQVLYYLKTKPGSSVNLDDYDGKRVGVNSPVERFRGWSRIVTAEEIEVLYENPDFFLKPAN